MSDMNDNRDKPSAAPGFAIVGCFIVGIAGLLGGLFAVDRNDTTGVGVCLLASARAFGRAAHAVFRK